MRVSKRLIAKIRDISMPATKCATQNSGVEVMKICQFWRPFGAVGKKLQENERGHQREQWARD